MDLTHYPYPSRRHVVLGRRGAVATSQPLAALAGMETLCWTYAVLKSPDKMGLR
jgi:hypothetical protein